jgi:hypothetical protein
VPRQIAPSPRTLIKNKANAAWSRHQPLPLNSLLFAFL